MRIPSDKKTFLVKSFFGFLAVAMILYLLMEYVFGFEKVGVMSAIFVLGCAFPIFCHEVLTRGEDFHKEMCPSNEAVVYFYDPFHFHPPRNYGHQIWDDQKCLTYLIMQTYSVLTLPPGEKVFYVDYKHGKNKLNLKLEAGHSYFVKVTPGFISAKLSVVPEQQALSEISSCDKKACF
ncbi:MAG: hypothetical protein J6Y85_02475 [Alphaproteobacteria bacterium]|nr:hypothetical protein [Alphaproteobacteria bacterium]